MTVTTTDGKAVEAVRTGLNEYTFTMPDADVKISAKALKKIPVYTIDFKLADGTMVDQKTVAEGEVIPLPSPEPTTDGYTLSLIHI